jgi:hypothetical protein
VLLSYYVGALALPVDALYPNFDTRVRFCDPRVAINFLPPSRQIALPTWTMVRLVLPSLWLAAQAAADALLTLPAVYSTDPGFEACVQAASGLGYCSSVSPGAPYSRMAQCLCCSSSAPQPSDFDGRATSCANFLHSVVPGSTAAYSRMMLLLTPPSPVVYTLTKSSLLGPGVFLWCSEWHL